MRKEAVRFTAPGGGLAARPQLEARQPVTRFSPQRECGQRVGCLDLELMAARTSLRAGSTGHRAARLRSVFRGEGLQRIGWPGAEKGEKWNN